MYFHYTTGQPDKAMKLLFKSKSRPNISLSAGHRTTLFLNYVLT